MVLKPTKKIWRYRPRGVAFLVNTAHHAKLGLSLARHACGVWAKVKLITLAGGLSLKQRTRWAATPVCIPLCVGGVRRNVWLATHSDIEVLREILIVGEYDELPVNDASLIVDLGAHIGIATLFLLARLPNARVLAVEADPQLMAQLRANVAGLPVTTVNAAVCDTSGPRTLYRSDVFSWGNSVVGQAYASQTPAQTHGVTFAELLKEHCISNVDLLKLDIEGAEWQAFPDGLPTAVRAVVGEVHQDGVRPLAEGVDRMCPGMTVVTVGDPTGGRLLFRASRRAVSSG